MTRLFAVAAGAVTLAAILACTGGATEPWPDVPREERLFSFESPPEFLQDKDLPWYGGLIAVASDGSMTVSYSVYDKPGFTPQMLHEVWHEAFLSYGWENEIYSVVEPRMSLHAVYTRADGPKVRLSIQRDGSVWYVNIVSHPSSEEE